MNQVKEHTRLESILPVLHNHRDHGKYNPKNKKETNKLLRTKHKTPTPHKHHKDFNRTKQIQAIEQIKKKTIEKFKNLTKK